MTERYGTLDVDGEYATMTFVRQLPYPIESVWAAITDPEQRSGWFGRTTVDGQVGGTIEMVPAETPAPPEQKRMTGWTLVWDPPYVFEHEWCQGIVDDGVVRYELQPDGEGTILTFVHRGLRVDNARGFVPGTHAFLDRLEAYLAGESLPGWWARYQEVAPGYASP